MVVCALGSAAKVLPGPAAHRRVERYAELVTRGSWTSTCGWFQVPVCPRDLGEAEGSSRRQYCAGVVDYDAVRAAALPEFAAAIGCVRLTRAQTPWPEQPLRHSRTEQSAPMNPSWQAHSPVAATQSPLSEHRLGHSI